METKKSNSVGVPELGFAVKVPEAKDHKAEAIAFLKAAIRGVEALTMLPGDYFDALKTGVQEALTGKFKEASSVPVSTGVRRGRKPGRKAGKKAAKKASKGEKKTKAKTLDAAGLALVKEVQENMTESAAEELKARFKEAKVPLAKGNHKTEVARMLATRSQYQAQL